MSFNLQTWQTTLAERWKGWRPRGHKLAADSLYLTLAGMTLWPVAFAHQQGEAMALFALGQLLASVGSGLLANVVQRPV